MRTRYILPVLLLLSGALHAQSIAPARLSLPQTSYYSLQHEGISVPFDSDNIPKIIGSDPMRYDKYGDLLNDDIRYYPKAPFFVPIGKIIFANFMLWAADRYIYNYDYSRVGFNSWAKNFREGWEWDADNFGINFFAHPYTGAGYFNSARSTGYTFYEALPYTMFGSLMWEYLGETTRPSYSDIINTTVSGAFGGEILYRLGSNLLDDRTSGAERFFREFGAAILSPTRFTSRLLNGHLTRHTTEETFQKSTLNTTLFGGIYLRNEDNKFGTGKITEIFGIQFDYGNPFENRARKPFDVFKFRGELNLVTTGKIVNNISGYGLLFGKNIESEHAPTLYGGFQSYDYWDNSTIELGTIGLGAGIISKVDLPFKSRLYSTFRLSIIPLAGNSSIEGPDTLADVRDYNYGGGAEAQLEATLTLFDFIRADVTANYYWIHTYVGLRGNNYVGILKPRITVDITKSISLGFENLTFFDDRYPRFSVDENPRPTQHFVRTEQKVFLQIFFENSSRGGRFN